MATGLNRALQVRTADRLRAELARDSVTGLPVASALSEADRIELCEVGGGRLAAVAICIDSWTPGEVELNLAQQDRERTLVVREVARLVDKHVRRTDLVGWLSRQALLVLAPGIDAVGGRSLAVRIQVLLAERRVDIDGMSLALRVRVGTASRCYASPSSWTVSGLIAEAELQASEPVALRTVG